jgi:hypothetical protein
MWDALQTKLAWSKSVAVETALSVVIATAITKAWNYTYRFARHKLAPPVPQGVPVAAAARSMHTPTHQAHAYRS